VSTLQAVIASTRLMTGPATYLCLYTLRRFYL
jgi:hypothetical protein